MSEAARPRSRSLPDAPVRYRLCAVASFSLFGFQLLYASQTWRRQARYTARIWALPPLIDEFREPGNQFEARFGAFAAGVGSAEQGTFDLNASLLTPRLNPGLQGYAAYLLPRLQFGGALNLAGRTSFAYADIALTLPIVKKLFFEPFLGGAIHNGSLTPTPTLSGLGCPVLIHAGFTFGIAVTEHWTALATFEHLSNGKGLGVDCGTNQALGTNQGLNNYGLSVGYAF
jgi:lipid A 3-O-deacylase